MKFGPFILTQTIQDGQVIPKLDDRLFAPLPFITIFGYTDTMAQRTKLTRQRKQTFLEHLRETCNVTESAQLAGVSRTAMYERRAIDPELSKAWDDAIEQATDALEKEARRRALDGVDRPVYFQGKRVGITKEYSDPLLMFMLRGHRPAKYRETAHALPPPDKAPTLNVIVLARQVSLAARLLDNNLLQGVTEPLVAIEVDDKDK